MKTTIKPYEELDLKIYGYTLRNVPSHQGYVKIGETNRIVNTRIKEQLGTAGLNHDLLFERIAQKSDGTWFHDRDLHRYLLKNNIRRENFGTSANEWFYFNGHLERAEDLTDEFINRDHDEIQISHDKTEYILRYEQKLAVEQTYEYYEKNREFDDDKINQFLWNAKPRFGKTLTTYDFIRKIEARNVLIVTNRPAIANSWYEDFHKFIGWRKPHLRFVSETDSLKDKAISREEFINNFSTDEDTFGQIVFISLQDLKGAKFAGGDYDKLNWVPQINWDLLVIDEAHEGVETDKTERAFNKINRSFTLHLSGTPFKALSNEKFSSDQIYNWSYLDEQKTKLNWNYNHGTNPYEQLPTLNLFTYQMSKMIESQVEKGIKLEDDTNMDYAFDLNEFFSTNDKGEFEYENSVKAFLNNLCTGKFPFSKDEYRKELNHTFWLLPWVSSAKALEKLLRNHPIFGEYRIILAAGDGITLDNEIDEETEFINNLDDFRANEKSYDRVKKGIKENEKTITISVGQLTTGVTIPEWTAVFMLNNIKSPSLYFQAAFRAQNPYEFEKDGKLYRKENSYIFDFAPDRTLQLYDEFAVNLNPAEKPGRKNNIKELVNFFPVIGEDELGSMKELDAEEVLAIPRLIKAKEVVKRGFMSNLLFNNISGIFRAPDQVKAILEKIRPEEQKKLGNRKEVVIEEVMTDDDGNVEIPESITINTTENLFGEKIYKTLDLPNLKNIKTEDKTEKEKEISKFVKNITKDISKSSNDGFEKLREEFSLTKRQQENVKDTFEMTIEKTVEKQVEEYVTQLEEIEKTKETKLQTAVEDTEKYEVIKEFEDKKIEIENTFSESIDKNVKEVITETVEKEIVKVEEKKKNKTEESVRQHLRGFSRTIPSFLMAYGTEETTLRNFEKNIDEDVFEEISGITVEEFRKLRDGFDYVDDEGNNRKFKGLFDEIVFNTSIKHFFEKKIELANYFDENLREDIFDYIPPQETNQIYTPKSVVKMMVDKLEQHNPEIFKDYNTKFADLYSKSGLYITEIVKRLNKGLEEHIPNRDERIKHILENQVYGVCPSKIIYNIVKNYVFGNFENINTKNLIILDTAKAAENGKMKEELEKVYGERNMKFDVIIGNPPYQEEDGGSKASARPLYHNFIFSSKELNPEYISFIIPTRWYTGGKGLSEFRKMMLNDPHIKEMHDFLNPEEIFPNTNIRGGVCFYVWDKDYNNIDNLVNFHTYKNKIKISEVRRPMKIKDIDILLRDSNSFGILDKIFDNNKTETLNKYISSRKPFGLDTTFIINDNFKASKDGMDNPLICYGRGNKIGYVEKDEIKINTEWIDKWKVFTPYANNVGTELNDDNINSITGQPGSICTESLLVIGGDLDLDNYSSKNISKYLKTKLLRYLHSLTKSSHHATSITYRFVPLQDFTENSDIDWRKSISEIDKQLYKKYGLDEKEIEFIEKNVKPME